jgi:hypothetical protein
MNFTTPQPEGRTSIGDTHLELIAACLPGNAATVHWACGLPLSFVQEMADRALTQHDRTTRSSLPVDPASDIGNGENAATK